MGFTVVGGRGTWGRRVRPVGGMFTHAAPGRATMDLEEGPHRALRSALAQRLVLHARGLELDGDAAGARGGERDPYDVNQVKRVMR